MYIQPLFMPNTRIENAAANIAPIKAPKILINRFFIPSTHLHKLYSLNFTKELVKNQFIVIYEWRYFFRN